MAKLSAHGHEVWRAVKVLEHDPDTLEDEAVIGRRREYRLMSDGAVLKCFFWTYLNPFTELPQSESTGWKRYARVKAGQTPEAVAAVFASQGYTIEYCTTR